MIHFFLIGAAIINPINSQELSERKSFLEKNLALSYYKEQEHEKAFKTFINALNLENTAQDDKARLNLSPSNEEKTLYEDALKIYLNHDNSLQAIAEAIQQTYAPILLEHPDYHSLAFIVAAANANQNKFDLFFEQFYNSYRYLPDHYLAYKTKAMLHAKLFLRAKSPIERENERLEILKNLSAAIARYPQDTSLYKMSLVTATEKEKDILITEFLNNIIADNIMIPRTDIFFYVKEAVTARQINLARQFINKAKEWYQYSRSMDEAQKYLEKNTNE